MTQLLEDRARLANVMKARPRGKESDTYLPVNLDRLITTARRNERITHKSQSDLDPKEVRTDRCPPVLLSVLASPHSVTHHIQHKQILLTQVIREIQELCAKTVVVPGEDSFSVEAQKNATIMFHIMLRATFAAKRVLYEFRLTKNALRYITGQIESHYIHVSQSEQE